MNWCVANFLIPFSFFYNIKKSLGLKVEINASNIFTNISRGVFLYSPVCRNTFYLSNPLTYAIFLFINERENLKCVHKIKNHTYKIQTQHKYEHNYVSIIRLRRSVPSGTIREVFSFSDRLVSWRQTSHAI